MKFHRVGAVAATVAGLLAGGTVQAMPTLVGVPVVPITAGASFIITLQDSDIADGYDASIGIYLADFLLTFDNTRLSLTVTPNAALTSPDWALTATPAGSTAQLQAVGFPTVTSGPLDLFALEFTALASGTADFSISAPVGGSYGADAAAYADVAASAAIQADTTPRDLPEPQSLALMAVAGLGAIAARRRSRTSR